VHVATARDHCAPLDGPSRLARPTHERRRDEPSDEQLFTAHVVGEPGAFERLFLRHAVRIYAMMRRRGLSHADSQDLVQLTFLATHQARHDFRSGSAFLPWLWTIAYNLLRGAYRNQGRVARQTERARSGDLLHLPAPDEAGRGVRQAIARLTSNQQEVIVLHWYEGLSFQEIGQVLCASESAVKVRAHRAYEKLRELLHEPLDREPGE
jgi:RNA polymerase sigma factor (sigma-70 family)